MDTRNTVLIDEIMKKAERHCYDFAAWGLHHAAKITNERAFFDNFKKAFKGRAEWIADSFIDAFFYTVHTIVLYQGNEPYTTIDIMPDENHEPGGITRISMGENAAEALDALLNEFPTPRAELNFDHADT